jgi:DNA-binding MarR family transcriptional regulator
VSNCVAWKIRRAARVLTRIYDEALAPHGLTSMQLGTLDALSDMGSATLAQIAEVGGHERTATWRGLQPLIRRGLVRQAAKSERAGRYELTDEGAALFTASLEAWSGVQDRVLAEIGDNLDVLMTRVEALDAKPRRSRKAAAS